MKSMRNSFLPAIIAVCVLISGILIPVEISAKYWIKEEVQYADPAEDPHLSIDRDCSGTAAGEAVGKGVNLWRIHICVMLEQLIELNY